MEILGHVNTLVSVCVFHSFLPQTTRKVISPSFPASYLSLSDISEQIEGPIHKLRQWPLTATRPFSYVCVTKQGMANLAMESDDHQPVKSSPIHIHAASLD